MKKTKKMFYILFIVTNVILLQFVNCINTYGALKKGIYRLDNDYIGNSMYVNETGNIIVTSGNDNSILIPIINMFTDEIVYIGKYFFDSSLYEYYDLTGNIFMTKENKDRIILATTENLLFANGSFYNLKQKELHDKNYFIKEENSYYEAYKYGNQIIVQDMENHIYILDRELNLVKKMNGYVDRDVKEDINGNVYDVELSIFDSKYFRVYDKDSEEHFYDEKLNEINKNIINNTKEKKLGEKYIAIVDNNKVYENYNYNINIYDLNRKNIRTYVDLQSVNEITVGNKKYFAFSKRLSKAGLWEYVFITDEDFKEVRETSIRFYGNNTNNTWFRQFNNIDLEKRAILIFEKEYENYNTYIIEYCDENLNTIYTYELIKGEEIVSATDEYFVTRYRNEKYNLYKVKEGLKLEDLLDLKLHKDYIVYSNNDEYGIMDIDLNTIQNYEIINDSK